MAIQTVENPAVVSFLANLTPIFVTLLGPLMTGLGQYSALRYIEASRTMIIQATRRMFVAIGAIIYLNILPEAMQIIGGIITIVGVIVITLGKKMMKRRVYRG